VFQKSIEAIISQGTKDLENLIKQTRQAGDDARIKVSQCQSEIQSLVNLAKQVPEKVFDRYSNVLVSTVELYNEYTCFDGYVQINGCQAHLRGVMGDEKFKRGKYRVIVLVEPLS
jgi:hypothetical protein